MTDTPPPSLRDRIAASLRTAAYDCDGCDLTERECDDQHPIQAAVLHHDVITSVYGDIDAIAAAVLAVVQPEIDRLRADLAAVRDRTLTEAAEVLRQATVPAHQTDGLDAAADILDAARDTTS
ncbi:hypothetical protein P3T27_006533 [Kitasatospora sp. MAA19]|uniref:hypothetical protein n=1 Tax=Kitasatospora sp. MAA19 TaxID=3035090 RepID=UPI002475BD6F|nr:hypothetical protein [Kitasatospora sp. MAA19]MDH6709784.1 hypothetical protein [Kitasatospora sp. MAA19]